MTAEKVGKALRSHRSPGLRPDRLSGTGQKGPKVMSGSHAILDLVGRLCADVPRTPSATERAIGVALAEAGPPHPGGKFQARDATGVDGIHFDEVELRIRGGKEGAGGLLVLCIGPGGCPRLAEVRQRFEGLAISDHPRGRSLDEETQFSRQEPWGTLTFGFAERDPDSLRTIVLKFGPQIR